MPNKESAIQWLKKAYHDLTGATILYEANHYNDTIGYILQQSLEKILKSFFAHNNLPIKKTHNLLMLYDKVSLEFPLNLSENDIRLIGKATTYSTKLRYPIAAKDQIPSNKEIKDILDLTNKLFFMALEILTIDFEEIR